MSSVNSQINDSVSSTIATVLGNAPAQGFGLLDTVMAETVGMMMHNAVTAQQNAQMVGNAAVTATCAKMLQVQPPGGKSKKTTPPPFSPPIFSPPGSSNSPINQNAQAAKTAIDNLNKELKTSTADEAKARAALQELSDVAKEDAENKL